MNEQLSRRQFFTAAGRGVAMVGAAGAALATGARPLGAMTSSMSMPMQGGSQSSAGGMEMSDDAYRPVRRPAKADATPQMDTKALEAFERQLACPCPCTLDVYTCRTTDFNCGISPRVHRDVQALVDGGYSADEIMAAMTDTYGDFILMTPRKQGFNLLAWFAPFAAIAIGAALIGVLLRGWRRNSDNAAALATSSGPLGESAGAGVPTDATPTAGESPVLAAASADELAELDAVLRDDSR